MLKNLSIQSKLILMLLSVALTSIAVLGWIGFRSGRDTLTATISNQLVNIRVNKANLLQHELETLKDSLTTLAESQSTLDAYQAFREAFYELETKSFPREYDEKLEEWYRNQFLPKLEEFVDGSPELAIYMPRSSVSRYLQYQYIAKNPYPYEKMQGLDAADDDSSYSTIHRTYHPKIRKIAERFGWEDVHLIDPQTLDIVYSYEKSTEFATNLASGPYANSNLARLVQSVRNNMDRGDYRFADFEFYRPALNQPNAFVAAPIFEDNRMVGIITVQFPVKEINRVMTGNYQWEKEGLGKTGEVYLVGPDKIFRSRSRFMIEDKPTLLKELSQTHVSSSLLNRIDKSSSLIGYLQANTEPAQRALEGQEFKGVSLDYRNVPVLSSSAPIEVEGNRWAIIAEMDESEAYAPVRKYAWNVLVSSLGLMIGTTLLASLLSRIFVGPIRKLAAGARLVAKGRTDVTVKLKSKDELGELANSFNSMTQKLHQKTEQLQDKVRENEELLLNILPGSVAARRQGAAEDDRLSQHYSDLTVLFASIEGFETLQSERSEQESLALLNDLVVLEDEAAERFGVEKVKTAGTTYMAVCGLSVQRPDHTNRIVEFAQELVKILDRFNRDRGTQLQLIVGINAGPVVGGLVGRNKFIYDLWGDTVNIAQQLLEQATGHSRIIVTPVVYDRLHDLHSFEPAGEVVIKGKKPINTYKLVY